MIRIGDSATFSMAMITPQSRTVETRRYLITPTEWEGIVRKCVIDKKYVTLTLCIGYGDNLEYLPTESQWHSFVEDSVNKLISHGANKNNCRIDIINEPEKYCTKEQQANYINLAHNQVKGRFNIGGGCSELNRRVRYQYISSHANFEVLVVHLQGACDTKAKTIDNLNFAQNLAISHNRILDCNEANYKDVATSKGFEHLKMLVNEAEKFGCANIPIVFNNLDQSAFPGNTDRWKFLCFKVNGSLRSKYYNEWTGLMDSKGPVPNLPIIEEEDDDMKLENLKIGSKGNQVKWLQEILEEEYEYPNPGGADGVFGTLTDTQVKAYQADMGITVDGIVGKQTTFELIEKAGEHFKPDYWMTKLEIWMGFD